MRKLYLFYWDAGRMGCLRGLFVASEEDVAAVIGKKLYFGEVLGKHSCIKGVLKEEDISVVTDDQDFILNWLQEEYEEEG